uniref:Uncharacterized protein n=1 Tax=Romanomermis culicivorax TaxID=13658 RepID=A0A915HLG8_ROMCU
MLKVAKDCEKYTSITVKTNKGDMNKELLDTEIYRMERINNHALKLKDEELDLKCYPEHHPFGKGGLYSKRYIHVRPGDIIQHHLQNKHAQFKRNTQWILDEMSQLHDRNIEQGMYAVINTGKVEDIAAGDLIKKIEAKDQYMEANLNTMFSKIRGTKEYWSNVNTDLRATDENFGPCTFFYT